MKLTPVRAFAPALVVLAVALAGCSTGADSNDSGGSSSAADAPAREALVDGVDTEDFAAESAGRTSQKADLLAPTALIRKGNVSLQAVDVGKAKFDVQVVVDEHGGQVDRREDRDDDEGDAGYARMVLRVPVASFDEAMNELEGIGRAGRSRTPARRTSPPSSSTPGPGSRCSGAASRGSRCCSTRPSQHPRHHGHRGAALRSARPTSTRWSSSRPTSRTRPRWPTSTSTSTSGPDKAGGAEEGRGRLPHRARGRMERAHHVRGRAGDRRRGAAALAGRAPRPRPAICCCWSGRSVAGARTPSRRPPPPRGEPAPDSARVGLHELRQPRRAGRGRCSGSRRGRG